MDKRYLFFLWRICAVVGIPALAFVPSSILGNRPGTYASVVLLICFGFINHFVFDWAKDTYSTQEELEKSSWRKGRAASQVAWITAGVLLILELIP